MMLRNKPYYNYLHVQASRTANIAFTPYTKLNQSRRPMLLVTIFLSMAGTMFNF